MTSNYNIDLEIDLNVEDAFNSALCILSSNDKKIIVDNVLIIKPGYNDQFFTWYDTLYYPVISNTISTDNYKQEERSLLNIAIEQAPSGHIDKEQHYSLFKCNLILSFNLKEILHACRNKYEIEAKSHTFVFLKNYDLISNHLLSNDKLIFLKFWCSVLSDLQKRPLRSLNEQDMLKSLYAKITNVNK